ncbi:high-affinity branched-chain amino acid ABC transporter permease LivM [Sansalvadorimonas sp. 2012CJ34-2]|uniref:High-affinity branched-chain amino acid ABC transporter permease LivM n=1 Tax=Parendozoicomonas callyspongiae TaxID=2942213 RepID=A0ABT0PCX9_9GAMM|nr:high-affinity branched-chain amino acid ABC transporter permease LivM [Sansalvadorimonas sp. 2012CJ34-2]MCL6269239.1 high-affinity branched-chain amino acid ABC transporter permease LivM [Sansalvadorimonas sp. 2012CJ34-2]
MTQSKAFNALIPAVLFLLLSIPLMGLQLNQGQIIPTVTLQDNSTLVGIAFSTGFIFLFQLVREKIPFNGSSISNLISSPAQRVPSLHKHDSFKKILTVLLIASLFIWPLFSSRGAVDLGIHILIYVLLGLGLNVVVGLAGLLDLGFVGFYAVGAYGYALLNQYFGLDFWTCLLFSGALAALFGFILGFPVLRLRGDYLAIVTLGFGEIIRILLNNWSGLTGGPNGIGQIPPATLFGIEFSRNASEGGTTFHELLGISYSGSHKVIFLYLIALVITLLTVWVINRLRNMPIGRAWEALREDDIACQSLGMNKTTIKLSAFTIGAMFAGLAGTLFAARMSHISPESFTFIESAMILAIVVLGGMGSQFGVILAAIIIASLPELVRDFEQYRMLMFGVMMVVMMAWRPQGLMPMKRPHIEMRKKELEERAHEAPEATNTRKAQAA